MTEQQPKQLIAFTIHPGCENAIEAGSVDIYIVPNQPMTVKAFYSNKELAEWLVRYGPSEGSRVPPEELIEAMVEVVIAENNSISDDAIKAKVIGEITDGSE